MPIRRLLALLLCAYPMLGAAQERKITFTLDFISLGRHAPWYVPIAKGHYKEEGLDVTVVPSKGTADAIKAVETGIAPLGFIDVPSLVATGSAPTAQLVAVNYQEPPDCVVSLD